MSVALDSPYTPGTTATFTPGREQVTSTLQRTLVRVASEAGTFAGRIHVLSGARGVGKTSLLRGLERWARSVGLSTVFVTAGAGGVLAPLGTALHDRLADISPQPLPTHLWEAFTKIGVKLGPAEVAVDLARHPALGDDVGSFKAAIGALARARERANRGVVVFVDEFQDTPTAEIRTIATAWQELHGEAQQAGAQPLPAAMVTAGLSNTHERITEAASFGERFRYDTLGNLAPEAAGQAILQPALERGVFWDEAALVAVLERSAGYPYFVQLYAHEVWEAAPRRAGDRITVADVAASAASAAAQVAAFYRGRWLRATPAEQRLLVAIASSGSEELARSEIARALGVATTDLSMARASLLAKGILAAPRRGVLAFNAPGFGAFILEEIEG